MKTLKLTIKTSVAAFVLSAVYAHSAPITHTLRQGVNSYTGNTNTYTEYQGGNDNNNYGGQSYFAVYQPGNIAFMKWDLSSVDPGQTVTSASLFLSMGASAAVAGDYDLHRITRTGLNFGTASGTPEDGTVSYATSSYDAVTPVGWGTSNTGITGPVSGEDYETTPFTTFSLPDNPGVDSTITFGLDLATMQSWIDNPSSNLGFVILQRFERNDRILVHSANHPQESIRPQLTFDTIPEPSGMALLGFGLTVLCARRSFKCRKSAPNSVE